MKADMGLRFSVWRWRLRGVVAPLRPSKIKHNLILHTSNSLIACANELNGALCDHLFMAVATHNLPYRRGTRRHKTSNRALRRFCVPPVKQYRITLMVRMAFPTFYHHSLKLCQPSRRFRAQGQTHRRLEDCCWWCSAQSPQ